jgi:hypothetical protein
MLSGRIAIAILHDESPDYSVALVLFCAKKQGTGETPVPPLKEVNICLPLRRNNW